MPRPITVEIHQASILIVDDLRANVQLLEQMLAAAGYTRVTSTMKPEEVPALHLKNSYDLILLDLEMPVMDGFQVMENLKASAADDYLPVIVLTAQPGHKLRALAAGAKDFISKPFDLVEAKTRIHNLLEVRLLYRKLANYNNELEATVADRHGRIVRLRRAQDHMRHDAASKQLALLNALPAHIALLDAQGRITSVNQAWRDFAHANQLQAPACGVGLSYLDICDNTRGDTATEARQVAAGIRSVLAGAVSSVSLEYACHSATEKRWFLVAVTPLADQSPSGAVVMHLNITERKQDEQKFKDLLEAAPDAMVIISGDEKIELVNAQAVKLFGWGREELLGKKIDMLVPERFRNQQPKSWNRPFTQAMPWLMGPAIDLCGLRKDGGEFPVEINLSPMETSEGTLVISVIRDITEYRAAQTTITRLNRVYAVLSGINALIVRVSSRNELFRGACRIAVDDGGFRMAMIAIVDRGTLNLTPIASAGKDDGMLDAIRGLLASAEEAPKTMSARAIREKTVVVSNDSQNDRQVVLHDRYANSGVFSMVVLPLIVADEAVGVLAMYAGEIGFFQEEELKLLTELAGHIAYAMDHLDKQDRLHYLAYYDVLTGLANRSLFLERVAQHMRSAVIGGHQLALFLVDLERFKNINDNLGAHVGDELLRQVASWLTHHAGGDATLLARVGADHFAVVLPVLRPERDLTRLLDTWIAAFQKHAFQLNGSVFHISAKGGVAFSPGDGTDADTLFKHAEAALKKAKANGHRYLFYTETMTATGAASLTLENQLREALDHEEFELYYQPKVNLASGKMTSAEALIRWNDPRTGLVPPAQFIPVLEETGLIHEVGRWALRQAVKDYLGWRSAGLPVVPIAVNVSPLQLRDRNFIAEVRQAISMDEHAAAGLELEITESLIMENVEHSISSLRALREMGISIAIDDFGTGFSSLSYLSRFSVDSLKIDRAFVIEMTVATQGVALVSTIINLAHALKLKVVAEGVETEAQARLLRKLGCDEMQGYLFSRPVPGELFKARFLLPSTVA